MSQKIPFLLSLAALPACGPAVEDDPTVPDGGDPEKVVESCEKAFGALYGCYFEEYAEEYADEEVSEEDIDMYVSQLCGEYSGGFDEYGDVCKGAMEEVFACLASLSCGELTETIGEGALASSECRAVFEDAHSRCPELIGFCQGGSGSAGFENSCGETRTDCLDENDYGYECNAGDDEQLSCTCSINGSDMMTVSPEGSCGSEDFGAAVGAACGFPDGVFG